MAEKKKKRHVVRMNLEMSPQVRQTLEKLSDETDLSLSEVIRKSLAVYDILRSEIQSGGKVIIRTENSEKELVIV